MKDTLRDMLQENLRELFLWREELEKNLAEAPQGHLSSSKSNGCTQYYIRTRDADGIAKKRYLKRNEKTLIRNLAQKDYDCKMLQEVNRQIKSMERFVKEFAPAHFTDVYDDLAEDRKQLVCPLVEPEDKFVNKWQNISYAGLQFRKTQQEIYTERGERVRSKSEKIIADSLYRRGVPYRYEYPVYLQGLGTVYPDFICLHVKKRKEILWEHMGLMGDSAYCQKALKKEEMYIKNGYRTGIDIIYTHESSDCPISTKVIDQIIQDTFGN